MILSHLCLQLHKSSIARRMPRLLTGERLPAPDDHVDVERGELDAVAASPGALRGDHRGTATQEAVDHDVTASRAVHDRVRHQLDWLDRRVNSQEIALIAVPRE